MNCNWRNFAFILQIRLEFIVTRGQFHKAQMPKFVLQNAKIFVAFLLYNFIKALTPKFLRHNAKK